MKMRFSNSNEAFGNSRVIRALFCVVALLLAVPFAAHAQVTTAAIRGAVTDEQGAAIAGTDITITNMDTGFTRTAKAGNEGEYSFQSLPIGRYTLSVAREGFKTFEEKGIVLHVNDSLTLNAQLKVGARSETIEVVATTAQVELTSAELSGTVAGAQITQLPLNGRSFAQLVLMVPGVAARRMRTCFSWMAPTTLT
jgi:Carboxypeptidase regulatory-like domain